MAEELVFDAPVSRRGGGRIELNPNHCTTLDCVLQSARHVIDHLERCDRAGLDVNDLLGECRAQQQLAAALKREFFPERP